jgi:hypothetical protein
MDHRQVSVIITSTATAISNNIIILLIGIRHHHLGEEDHLLLWIYGNTARRHRSQRHLMFRPYSAVVVGILLRLVVAITTRPITATTNLRMRRRAISRMVDEDGHRIIPINIQMVVPTTSMTGIMLMHLHYIMRLVVLHLLEIRSSSIIMLAIPIRHLTNINNNNNNHHHHPNNHNSAILPYDGRRRIRVVVATTETTMLITSIIVSVAVPPGRSAIIVIIVGTTATAGVELGH